MSQKTPSEPLYVRDGDGFVGDGLAPLYLAPSVTIRADVGRVIRVAVDASDYHLTRPEDERPPYAPPAPGRAVWGEWPLPPDRVITIDGRGRPLEWCWPVGVQITEDDGECRLACEPNDGGAPEEVMLYLPIGPTRFEWLWNTLASCPDGKLMLHLSLAAWKNSDEHDWVAGEVPYFALDATRPSRVRGVTFEVSSRAPGPLPEPKDERRRRNGRRGLVGEPPKAGRAHIWDVGRFLFGRRAR